MKVYNHATGRLGEEAALGYLLKKGFELITRNYSTRYGEIDLIMRDKGTTVFVEVKTKKGLNWGTPEEMFTQAKLGQVRRMATIYLNGREVPCRIDMVAVLLVGNNTVEEITHYENVT